MGMHSLDAGFLPGISGCCHGLQMLSLECSLEPGMLEMRYSCWSEGLAKLLSR